MKFILWMIAAKSGSAVAKYNIGYIYKTGYNEPIRVDYDKAAQWYLEAYNANYLKARKKLDEIYEKTTQFKLDHPDYRRLMTDYTKFEA